jgi:16S rRNA G966 N2-methylase RsmD
MNKVVAAPYKWLRSTAGHLLFERRYGVRTAGKVLLDEFGLAGEDRVYYIPANWRTLHKTLQRNEVGPDDVFIDLGSGMGRMVLEAAATYPFKRVIGVELAQELHDIALSNVDNTRIRLKCKNIELVQSDVLEYAIPDDVTIVFMNNPFRGPVFAAAMKNLIASVDDHPRQVKVIYGNPAEDGYLMSTGRFRPLRTIAGPRADDDSPFGKIKLYSLIPAAGVS